MRGHTTLPKFRRENGALTFPDLPCCHTDKWVSGKRVPFQGTRWKACSTSGRHMQSKELACGGTPLSLNG